MGRTSFQPMSIVVAVDQVGGFAKNNSIPWNYPEDFKHFKQVTDRCPCIMGRHTYEEIAEKYKQREQKKHDKGKVSIPIEQVESILPGRRCFVVTSNPKYQAPGAIVVPSLTKAVNSLDKNNNQEIFVIGGARLFTEALTWANKVYMTVIPKTCKCDRFFPVYYVHKNFKIVDGERRKRIDFVTYRRK